MSNLVFTLGWLDLSALSLPQRIVCGAETSVLSLSMLRRAAHVWLLDLFGSGHIVSNPCVQVARERCRKSPGSRRKLDLYRAQAKTVAVSIRWPKSKNLDKKWSALIIKLSSNSLIWREKKPTKTTSFPAFRLLIPSKAEVKHCLFRWKVLCFPQCRNFHKEPFCVIERNIF